MSGPAGGGSGGGAGGAGGPRAVCLRVWSNPLVRSMMATLVGALLGIIVGWCTNAAMVEISINAIFALYFGFFFLFLCGVIVWRVVSFGQAANKKALLVLSAFMGAAGLICIVYQRTWFFSLSAVYRVPIYTILGVSLSFALSFAIAELLNFATSQATSWASPVAPKAQAALVQTPQQIFLLAAAAATLGFLYGVIFGVAEVGKGVLTMHVLRSQFLHEERICLPIGFIIGGVTGHLNNKWRPANGGDMSGGGSSHRDDVREHGRGGGGGLLAGFGSAPGGGGGSNSGGGVYYNRDHEDDMDDFDPFPSPAPPAHPANTQGPATGRHVY